MITIQPQIVEELENKNFRHDSAYYCSILGFVNNQSFLHKNINLYSNADGTDEIVHACPWYELLSSKNYFIRMCDDFLLVFHQWIIIWRLWYLILIHQYLASHRYCRHLLRKNRKAKAVLLLKQLKEPSYCNWFKNLEVLSMETLMVCPCKAKSIPNIWVNMDHNPTEQLWNTLVMLAGWTADKLDTSKAWATVIC